MINTKLFRYQIDIYPILYILALFILQLMVCAYATHWQAAIFAILSLPFFSIPAAFNHHHQHANTFYMPTMNRLLEAILGLQTGISSFMWFVHHVLGHHKHYLNQQEDSAKWINPKTKQPMKQVDFGRYNYFNGFRELRRVGKSYPKHYRHYQVFRALYYALIIVGFILFGWNFLIVVIMPSQIIAYYTIETTWHHHANLSLTDEYAASRNNLSKSYNIRTCNLGFHTAHHLKPALHWSLLPAYHAKIAAKIPSHLIYENIWHP